jgi:transposase
MAPYLENARHRQVFRHVLRGAYGGPRLTHREIAKKVGCSERTVERVQQTFERRWRPLVEQARREFDELVSRLEGPNR